MSDNLNLTVTEWSWFQHCLERGKHERFFEIVTISPAMAEVMLEMNTHNRRLAAKRATTHVSAIQGGRWQTTHQGLAFDKESRLLDGQHRLEAIAQAGVPVEIVVSFGWDPEVFTAVDTGAARTTDDFLNMEGMSYAPMRAAVARALVISGMPDKAQTPDKVLVVQKAREIAGPDLDEVLSLAFDIGSTRKIMRPSACALALYLIKTKSARSVRLPEFVDSLRTGANLPVNSPILKFREFIKKPRKEAGGGQIIAAHAGALILAWNAWVMDRRVGSLVWLSRSLPGIE